jgi:Bacterial RNA polymerase, alpha chain C terminal domain
MQSREDPYNVPVEDLCLTVRCYNVLKREGIHTVGELAVLPERHLMGLRDFTPRLMEELKARLEDLGLFPWDTPQSTGKAGSGTAGQAPGPRRPGRLCLSALSVTGALLPAHERDRWAEEWKGELHALGSRTARARFILSLLLAGGRRLAVTLRQVWPGEKPAWPSS